MASRNDKAYEGQMIGGIFTNRDDADGAIGALEELEVSSDDIEEFVQLDHTQSKEAHIVDAQLPP